MLDTGQTVNTILQLLNCFFIEWFAVLSFLSSVNNQPNYLILCGYKRWGCTFHNSKHDKKIKHFIWMIVIGLFSYEFIVHYKACTLPIVRGEPPPMSPILAEELKRRSHKSSEIKDGLSQVQSGCLVANVRCNSPKKVHLIQHDWLGT